MKDFRGLSVWRKAHAVTLEIYRVTRSFPREETYGITSQMRRCSSSVAANIAEGCGRRGNTEFADSLECRWAPRVSWNISFCSRVTWAM